MQNNTPSSDQPYSLQEWLLFYRCHRSATGTSSDSCCRCPRCGTNTVSFHKCWEVQDHPSHPHTSDQKRLYAVKKFPSAEKRLGTYPLSHKSKENKHSLCLEFFSLCVNGSFGVIFKTCGQEQPVNFSFFLGLFQLGHC